MLDKHRSPVSKALETERLARYILSLGSLCKDPRRFYGHDLITLLQYHEPTQDDEFALATLAACSSATHVRKRQIRRLLDIASGEITNVGKCRKSWNAFALFSHCQPLFRHDGNGFTCAPMHHHRPSTSTLAALHSKTGVGFGWLAGTAWKLRLTQKHGTSDASFTRSSAWQRIGLQSNGSFEMDLRPSKNRRRVERGAVARRPRPVDWCRFNSRHYLGSRLQRSR